jgi:hypothetical protein
MKIKYALLFLSGLFYLNAQAQQNGPDSLLLSILRGKSEVMDTVLQHPEKYGVQILYTQIDRDANNHPTFRSYRYRVNRKDYFYPASTVKLPAVLLALEKLNSLKKSGLTKYTTMLTDSACCGQTAVNSDASAQSFMPSLAHYIRKILVISDNDAYNRLYEFLGQEYFNDALRAKGYADVRIASRLSVGASREQNRFTNPVRFVKNGKVVYKQSLVKSGRDYVASGPILIGKGEMKGDSLIRQPKDFAYANSFPLEEQQAVLRAVLFPESVAKTQRFNLTADDYRFLYQYMSQLPRETRYPVYDQPEHVDGYVKFLLFGDLKDTLIPSHIRIFNKVGDAYGFLTDNAYVVDFKNGVEFMLSATIYVNENQIFNDDRYEYDTIGFPFLGNLGRVVYDYELTRKKKHKPVLDRLRLKYDISTAK